jgi:hypothetical protein
MGILEDHANLQLGPTESADRVRNWQFQAILHPSRRMAVTGVQFNSRSAFNQSCVCSRGILVKVPFLTAVRPSFDISTPQLKIRWFIRGIIIFTDQFKG